MRSLCAILVVLAGCTGEVDPEWQLSHDRVIAVRIDTARDRGGRDLAGRRV